MLRARVILGSRDAEQVHWGGLVVQWLLTEALPELMAEAKAQGREPLVAQDEPTVAELVRLRRYLAIDGIEYFPNATWPELLAAYAMNCLGQAHGTFQFKRDLESPDSKPNEDLIGSLDRKFLAEVLEASEAVHFGERIAGVQDDALIEAELLITRQQRDKGVKRHAKTRAVIERFFVFFANDEGSNRSHAARIFLKRLSSEERALFTEDEENAARTLTRNLATYLKEQENRERGAE